MADLITRDYAKQALQQDTSFSAAEDAIIDALKASVSKAIKKYCRREFDSQTFDELYGYAQGDLLILRQFPVISVNRVAGGRKGVLQVRNTSTTNQRATVAVTATGLTLVRVASGVVTTDTSVTFAANVTLTAVATAVNVLGNGWAAEVINSTYTNWPSADLYDPQGALNVANSVWGEIWHHTDELSGFTLNEVNGWLVNLSGYWSSLGDAILIVDCQTHSLYRVIYTAGYATVPEDVQMACAEWVRHLYFAWKRDPSITAIAPTTGDTLSFQDTASTLATLAVKELLAPYRRYARV